MYSLQLFIMLFPYFVGEKKSADTKGQHGLVKDQCSLHMLPVQEQLSQAS